MADDAAFPPSPLQVALANIRIFVKSEQQRPYWNESLHLVVPITGCGTVRIDRTSHDVVPGQILAIPWGRPVSYSSDAEHGLTIASIHLVPWDGDDLPPAPVGAWTNNPRRPCQTTFPLPSLPAGTVQPLSQPHVADLAQAAVTTWNDRSYPDAWRACRLRSLAYCLLTAFHARTHRSSLLEGLIWRMQSHLGTNLTRADMCRISGLGSTALGKAIREATGMPPGVWRTSLRLDEARRLLTTTAMPVAEIAKRIGFSDRTHFSVLYRRRFGHPPRDDRKTGV